MTTKTGAGIAVAAGAASIAGIALFAPYATEILAVIGIGVISFAATFIALIVFR